MPASSCCFAAARPGRSKEKNKIIEEEVEEGERWVFEEIVEGKDNEGEGRSVRQSYIVVGNSVK